jgi:DNA-directed RNA polymerase beta subunit
MAYSIANNPLLRKNFAKIHKIIDIPNLIDIQKNSYKRFLQLDTPVDARKNSGLEAVFRSVFPIRTSATPPPSSTSPTRWARRSTMWKSATSAG